MQTRKPVVAGQFYSDDRDSCLADIKHCLKKVNFIEILPKSIVAGIVPHAGWMFSGSLAAMVFSAIKQRHEKVDTFVIFGAAHGYYGHEPAIYSSGSWTSPLGEISIDQTLAQTIIENNLAAEEINAHKYEHSIEVQIPFIQYLFPESQIVPILTPPTKQSIALGQGLGDIITSLDDKKIVCIGSTDLTHYGPRYGFTPMGSGEEGLKWATEVNDKHFIDAVLNMDAQKILASAAENSNACGAGAAAAAVSAAQNLGRTRGTLLAHTNSNEIMAERMNRRSAESVGYAAIIF
ncbi:MAG: AmmeMemoRadiSam system protein B [Phycisphaerae bacterium]